MPLLIDTNTNSQSRCRCRHHYKNHCFIILLFSAILSILTTSALAIAICSFSISETSLLTTPSRFGSYFLRRSPFRLTSLQNTNMSSIPEFSLGPRAKVLLLGSSMTQRSFSIDHQGWGSYLSNWFSRTADVMNRGSGGYNSRWLRQFLPEILGTIEGKPPAMAIIFIGNNDSVDDREPQHVSPAEYRENIEAMLAQLYQVKKNMIVLLVTTTPVNEHLKPKHSNQRRRRYAEILREIVKDHNRRVEELMDAVDSETSAETKALVLQGYHRPRYLGLVDLWSDDRFGGSPAIEIEDLHDGSHLDKNGNRKVFEAIKSCINGSFPFFSPDHLVIPRNHLRAKKSASGVATTDSKQEANNTTPASKRPYHHSHPRSHSQSGGGDDWWTEPAIHITLPPWHTLVPDHHSRQHSSAAAVAKNTSLVESSE